jgi:hypothetical protein
MDTNFWGKDGWIMLHSISYGYDGDYLKYYKLFFKSIKYILPCIYCRKSYKKYIKEIPFELPITKWLYKIHNCVNDKLRKQGYKIDSNPSFRNVNAFYKKYKYTISFDFIYCILFNYNLEISEKRKKGYLTFFNCLQYLLPDEKIKSIYTEYILKNPLEECLIRVEKTKSLEILKIWGHNLEKYIKKKCRNFKSLCKKIEKYRVNNCTKNTCRKNIN